MRFQTTVRPVLTPLGQRLMSLSERKLYGLEPLVGGRDEATLLKGVLVREAVRSAWRSVESGHQVEVNNWQSESAMGLNVIGEEEEEDDGEEAALVEEKNERWFEELVQSFGDDDGEEEHEWAESEVGTPIDYDEFDEDEFQHYTLPSPPPLSPTQLPTSPTSSMLPLSPLSSPPSPSFTLGPDPEPADASVASTTAGITVDVLEVDDLYGDDDPYRHRHHTRYTLEEVSSGPVQKDATPSTPILSATCSPSSPISSLDDDLETDDLILPPALHRCSSTSSVPCYECDDDRSDDGCLTPPLSSDTLELSVGSVLSLANDDIEYDDVDHFDYIVEQEDKARLELQRDPPTLGLGLDVGIEMISFS